MARLVFDPGYAVTPKADGDRAMLYISESGNLYLIYRRMEVKTTGLRLESLHGTLLDGELVTTNREGQKIRLFLVFDLYFLDKNDVRGFPFQRTLLISSNTKVLMVEWVYHTVVMNYWNKV